MVKTIPKRDDESIRDGPDHPKREIVSIRDGLYHLLPCSVGLAPGVFAGTGATA